MPLTLTIHPIGPERRPDWYEAWIGDIVGVAVSTERAAVLDLRRIIEGKYTEEFAKPYLEVIDLHLSKTPRT